MDCGPNEESLSVWIFLDGEKKMLANLPKEVDGSLGVVVDVELSAQHKWLARIPRAYLRGS